MAKEGGGPDWNGLLKWSLAHGGEGTAAPRALSEEDRKWFMEAMQVNTIDVVGRMKEIAQVMKTPDDVLHTMPCTSAGSPRRTLMQFTSGHGYVFAKCHNEASMTQRLACAP